MKKLLCFLGLHDWKYFVGVRCCRRKECTASQEISQLGWRKEP